MAKKENNLIGMKTEDLEKDLKRLREELRVFKFKGQGAKSKNVKEPGSIKRKIARILTEINSVKNVKNK